jgi:signal peptidase I
MSWMQRRRLRRARKALQPIVAKGRRVLRRKTPDAAGERAKLEAALEEGTRMLLNGQDERRMEVAGNEIVEAVYGSSYARGMLPPALVSILELLLFVLLALTVRAFLYEPFKIPTGSMRPTLLHGDHVFIKKFRYGPRWPFTTNRIWDGRPPERGEVAVFNFPEDPTQDYIKRIVAVAGDTVAVRGGRLWVNGVANPRERLATHCFLRTDERALAGFPQRAHLYRERTGHRWHYTLGGKSLNDSAALGGGEASMWRQNRAHRFYNDWPRAWLADGVPPPGGAPVFHSEGRGLSCTAARCRVLPGFLFAMGDNRDGSADSRVWGGVPVNYLRGDATKIWLSHDWTEPVIPLGSMTLGTLRSERLMSDVYLPKSALTAARAGRQPSEDCTVQPTSTSR